MRKMITELITDHFSELCLHHWPRYPNDLLILMGAYDSNADVHMQLVSIRIFDDYVVTSLQSAMMGFFNRPAFGTYDASRPWHERRFEVCNPEFPNNLFKLIDSYVDIAENTGHYCVRNLKAKSDG